MSDESNALSFARDWGAAILALLTPVGLALKYMMDRGDIRHSALTNAMIEERKRLSEDTAAMIDRLEKEIVRLQSALALAEQLNAQYIKELITCRDIIAKLEARLNTHTTPIPYAG